MTSIPQLYSIYQQYPSVQTDTRALKAGDLYFALKGPNFNGNTFAQAALDAGAAYSIVDEAPAVPNERILVVDNVLHTLQQLAKHHRQQFNIPFIAITGSNGKTTTKELVSTVLAAKYKTYTTQGNLNNHIGIPLTILRVKPDAEMAVIEMGANHQLEIADYCTYTLPTHGIITNAGKAHLEGFGGIEGVRKGKGELYDYLRATNGTAFVMWDYDYLQQMSKGISNMITYGTSDATVTGQVAQSEPFLSVNISSGKPFSIHSKLVGAYNLPNILVAVTVGQHFGVTNEAIQSAIENYTPSNSRSQLITAGSNQIILDAYNANPSSMRAAIENFASLSGKDKVLMLGGMMELGPESLQEHQQIVDLISQYPWKAVVLVGEDFRKLQHPFVDLENAAAAKEWLTAQQFEHTHILVKGSRSMKMEQVL
ncbi:UDP-N-acetylmuramoyl-tripeptide--D-alanyl-D-alanine ligase [Pseudoflavitalea sp. G-6-1-2]|uniref:UDP-N-acetylmuramoyl-tripeptide--D-alanyl-D- alanine ligase n=1 Tax=Pseudoflavitalea sp. G-6-1-2 TaxID=2728841 RepID=UPI00146EF4E9|nr:UDP-N-acetylmuramoyl-tripeptide--D-alanyl-D-alanine ligase [Pseudoflavitalea sp. G-6-1-2]NML19391.1 UDP-N-acetylmuramoyl-tripeptide--D-alanyl-D-alanine ligase [Pseudoflavitalea sp. G-6-1-2]